MAGNDKFLVQRKWIHFVDLLRETCDELVTINIRKSKKVRVTVAHLSRGRAPSAEDNRLTLNFRALGD